MSFTFTPTTQDVLWFNVCRATVLQVSLSGTFIQSSGDVGRYLHARYVITDQANEAVRPAVTGLGTTPDGNMEVEFDLAGEVQLNWPGALYLTGGNPLFPIGIRAYKRDAPFRKTWHPLVSRVVNPPMPIPFHHTRISAYETVSFTLNGATGELGPIPIPCVGGLLQIPGDGQTVITEWYG
jgi:hypothetical protein